jgi:asparagine synthase (glutamine-hydrolysing)
MCGIAGIVAENSRIETKRLNKLKKSLIHRGPDDYGEWINENQTIGLAQTRLSIIDLTRAGHQPMQTSDGRYTIVLNGEIYNYQDLKKDLEDQGVCFASSSDTEVLLEIWAKRGINALEVIRGMFAFAIWDSLESRLSLVRDPMGIKPLYFSKFSNGLAFASESKALQLVGFGKEINPEAVGVFLQLGSIPPPLTLYHEIESLLPGQLIQWDQSTGSISKNIYWSYSGLFDAENPHPHVNNYDEALELTRQTLLNSIKAHLVSDVPVAAFLSGGIDSTAVVSLMRQAGQEQIDTFSICFDDKILDESYYAQIASQVYNTEHHEWRVGRDEFFDLKDKFMVSMDSPTIDGLNIWLAARFASQHGFKVATSGIGGDELFYGYEGTFRRLPALMKYLSVVPACIKNIAIKTMDFPCVNNINTQKINKAISLFEVSPNLGRGYLAYKGLFSKHDIKELISNKDFAHVAASVDMDEFLPILPKNSTNEQKISVLETSCYLANQLLPDSDRFSMAHALELRVPLVDRMVTENLSLIDPKYFKDKITTPKSLLVNAVGDIPNEIVYRKKMGFTLPIGNWLKEEEWEPKSKLLNKDACKKLIFEFHRGKLHWSRRWALEVLDTILMS